MTSNFNLVFSFFWGRFPHLCLNNVSIFSVQHFILFIPDYRHINFQWFPHFPIIIPTFHEESFGVKPVKMSMALLCVFGCSRVWPVTFDSFLLVLYWPTNDFLFCFNFLYHLIFLEQCLTHDVTPKSFRTKPPIKS